MTPIDAMQKAVDIVNTSQHPKNKVAATLFGRDINGASYNISATNYWPPIVLERLGQETRIGSSSATIHAEIRCILQAKGTKNASICITDPCCPNCAKDIIESGIRNIYIDHKGFNKDFANRRKEAFENMSRPIIENVGGQLYEVRRKEGTITQLSPNKIRPDARHFDPVEIVALDDFDPAHFIEFAKEKHAKNNTRKSAIALAKDQDGVLFSLFARAHPAAGLSFKNEPPPPPHEKYSFMMEPINRLLMNAAKEGLTICNGYIYAAQVPIERELVNMLGADLNRIYIADKHIARRESAIEGIAILEQKGLMEFPDVL